MKNFCLSLVLAVTMALLSLPARAQNSVPFPGDTSIVTRTFDPKHPAQSVLTPVFNDPTLLRKVVNSAWQLSRASIGDQISGQMGVGNSIAPGVTPYDIVVQMGQPGELRATPGTYQNGSTLQMVYTVPGNYIEFTCTQPTAAGKWADPRFSCTYDLTLTMDMTIGDAPGPLNMRSVKAQVSNSKLDSHGLIADLVFVGNAVSAFFGTNFIRSAQNAVNGKNFDFTAQLNGQLAPFNAILAQYGAQGYGLIEAVLNAAQGAVPGGLGTLSVGGAPNSGSQLMLVMEGKTTAPLTGEGQITGAIRWKKAWGQPATGPEARRPILTPGGGGLTLLQRMHPYARAFKIRAVAQTGFGRDGTFVPPMSAIGKLQSATLETPETTGDNYVLRYSIVGLPLDVPIKVEVSFDPSVNWQGDVGAQQRVVGPDNWTGLITIRKGLDIGAVKSKTGIAGALRAAQGAAPGAGTGAETSIIIVGGKGTSAADAVALNPQPLPPKEAPKFNARIGTMVRSGDKVALNPQPLPPKIISGTIAGGLDNNATVSAIGKASNAAAVIAAQLPKPKRDNPTGRLVVADIDFDMGLLTGPR